MKYAIRNDRHCLGYKLPIVFVALAESRVSVTDPAFSGLNSAALTDKPDGAVPDPTLTAVGSYLRYECLRQ